MLDAKKMLDCAGKNISEILNMVDPAQIEEIATALAEAKRVFTAGWGRAGNVIRILGMDMSQIGKVVFCVGDNGTPSAHPGDLLIINSGSGNTKTIATLAAQAKEQGVKVALISGAAPDASIIGKIADINVTVPRLKNEFRPPVDNSKSKNKGLGERMDWGLSDEQREEMAYTEVTGYYEAAFALNEVIRKFVMEKIGAKTEDIMYYHNNLE